MKDPKDFIGILAPFKRHLTEDKPGAYFTRLLLKAILKLQDEDIDLQPKNVREDAIIGLAIKVEQYVEETFALDVVN